MIPYLVLRFESFDSDAVVEAFKNFDSKGIIIVWNYDGEVMIRQCPPSIPLKKLYRFYTPGTWTSIRWFKWPLLVLVCTRILITVTRREKISRFFIGGGDIVLWVAQIFKKFGRIERTITTLEDWSLPRRGDGIYAYLNALKLLFNDWLLFRMDTTVIVVTKELFAARNAFWGPKANKNALLYDRQWAWFLECKRKLIPTKPGADIAFLGTVRPLFGIELLFEILPELNKILGCRLKMMGPESTLYLEYKQTSQRMGIEHLIDWKGFVASDDLTKELENCFCGVNIHERKDNVSSFTIAGRVIHYMQNLIVPVVSPSSGSIVQIIRDSNLGVICEAEQGALKYAILDAHANRATYLANIVKFINENPHRVGVEKLLNPE